MSKLEMRLVKVCEECGQFVDADMSKICSDLDEDVCDCDDCLDDDCENCCCDEEDEFTDEELEIADILYEYTEEIVEAEFCPECIYSTLEELAEKFRSIGFKDCQEEMRSFLDEAD